MFVVRWKWLYIASIIMFAFSLVLLPISAEWSIIVVLALVTLWSRVPGLVHFVFNKLALNDLFTLIIAANSGWLVGSMFGVFGIMIARWFGEEWWPYSLRASIAVFTAGAAVPWILEMTGGLNVTSVYYFEAVLYAAYYLLVLLIWRSEIFLEVLLLPPVILFDFGMNAALMVLFGSTISNMMQFGLTSGWPFLIFAGVIVGFAILAHNGKRIGNFLTARWYRLIGKKSPGAAGLNPIDKELKELKQKLESGKRKVYDNYEELQAYETDAEVLQERMRELEEQKRQQEGRAKAALEAESVFTAKRRDEELKKLRDELLLKRKRERKRN